jgi:hypothetical protein
LEKRLKEEEDEYEWRELTAKILILKAKPKAAKKLTEEV